MLDDKLRADKYWNKVYELLSSKKSINKEKLTSIYENRESIKDILVGGSYEFELPTKILVPKPNGKKRIVYMFNEQDRMVIGVLYRVLSDYFSDIYSENCFSYRKRTTTLDAVKYLKNTTDLTTTFCLKIDISSYFNSVDSECITNTIEKIFVNDKKSVCYEYMKTLYSLRECIFEGSVIKEYMSLMAGTPISNFLGNLCLVDIDNTFRDLDGISYARYSDDILIFADSMDRLNYCDELLRNMLATKGLSTNKDKYILFKPGEFVSFLGLKFNSDAIDLSKESETKFKKDFKHMCKEGRQKIYTGEKTYTEVATKIMNRFNMRMYKCYLKDKTKYGWGYYAFRYITTEDTLLRLDYYVRDMLRWLKTGKHNSANIRKTTDEELHEIGYRSIVDMYRSFKLDFDLYLYKVELLDFI